MEFLKPLRAVWAAYIRPALYPEKPLNLFGHRCAKMQENLRALEPREKDRLMFYIAATAEDRPVRDYIDYIRQIAAFCAFCVTHSDSVWARDLDMAKIGQLKISADLLVEAVRRTDQAYLGRVRRDMWIPDFSAARHQVDRAEIRMLRDDIKTLSPPRP